MKFTEWMKLREMCGTFVAAPNKPGPHSTYNVWGAPGQPGGTTPAEGPVINEKKKKQKKK